MPSRLYGLGGAVRNPVAFNSDRQINSLSLGNDWVDEPSMIHGSRTARKNGGSTMKWLSFSHLAFRSCVAIALLYAGTATAQSIDGRMTSIAPHIYLAPSYRPSMTTLHFDTPLTTHFDTSIATPSYNDQVILQPTLLDQSISTTLQGRFDRTYANIHQTGPNTWAPNAGCHWVNNDANDFRVWCD